MWVKNNDYIVERLSFYRKACVLKYATACRNLGMLYSDKDEKESKKYFKKACDYGLNDDEYCK